MLEYHGIIKVMQLMKRMPTEDASDLIELDDNTLWVVMQHSASQAAAEARHERRRNRPLYMLDVTPACIADG